MSECLLYYIKDGITRWEKTYRKLMWQKYADIISDWLPHCQLILYFVPRLKSQEFILYTWRHVFVIQFLCKQWGCMNKFRSVPYNGVHWSSCRKICMYTKDRVDSCYQTWHRWLTCKKSPQFCWSGDCIHFYGFAILRELLLVTTLFFPQFFLSSLFLLLFSLFSPFFFDLLSCVVNMFWTFIHYIICDTWGRCEHMHDTTALQFMAAHSSCK